MAASAVNQHQHWICCKGKKKVYMCVSPPSVFSTPCGSLLSGTVFDTHLSGARLDVADCLSLCGGWKPKKKRSHSILPPPAISIFLLSFQFHLHFLVLYRLDFFFFFFVHLTKPLSTSLSSLLLSLLLLLCVWAPWRASPVLFILSLLLHLNAFTSSLCSEFACLYYLLASVWWLLSTLCFQGHLGPRPDICLCVFTKSRPWWVTNYSDAHTHTNRHTSSSLALIKRLVFSYPTKLVSPFNPLSVC